MKEDAEVGAMAAALLMQVQYSICVQTMTGYIIFLSSLELYGVNKAG